MRLQLIQVFQKSLSDFHKKRGITNPYKMKHKCRCHQLTNLEARAERPNYKYNGWKRWLYPAIANLMLVPGLLALCVTMFWMRLEDARYDINRRNRYY